MAVIARYLMVNQKDMTRLLDAGPDLLELITDLGADVRYTRIDIGTRWDALHYVMTGVTASEPLDEHPLSDAVVGVQLFFEDDDADFIAFTPNPDLPPIIEALKAVDLPAKVRAFTPTPKQRVEAYPDGIFDGDREGLLAELFVTMETLINFYETALESGRHVIVSIL